MRVFMTVCLMLSLAGGASALEASAGADTINSSQVGITAKLDASNALLQAAINELTARIKICSGRQSLYNPGGAGADADGCVPVATGKKLVKASSYDTGYNKSKTLGPSNADLCLLSMTDLGSADDFRAGCQVTGGPNDWKLVADTSGRSNAQCKMVCYNWQ